MEKKTLTYIFLIILVLPAVWPLLQPGYFVSDDGNWMVIRLSAFHETIRTGQFPVRFLERLNHGYGYPVTNFLYPLPFYLGEVVHLLGFNFVDSVKILFELSFFLGAIFMYRYAGMFAALVYTYFPYRLFDVYKRGSLGESVAFIFPPLIFYYLEKKNIVLSAIFMAALVTSHNVVALIFLPVFLAYSTIWFLGSNKKRGDLILAASPYLLAACLSAWFWLPAIYDLQFTRAASVQVSDFTKYFLTFP